jgi:RimJ/RimL family protein N-acetyltransferase
MNMHSSMESQHALQEPAPAAAQGEPRSANQPKGNLRRDANEANGREPPGRASSRSAKAAATAFGASAESLARAGDVSPLAAAAWANAILQFWEDGLACGEIDVANPLDVLDLAGGDIATVWVMLRALLSRCDKRRVPVRIRYLVVAPRRALLEPVRRHAALAPSLAQGVLVPLLWNPERGDPCLLSPTGRTPWQPANPVVVVAHDLWRQLPQRLFAVHYGKLLEADPTGRKAVVRVDPGPIADTSQPRMPGVEDSAMVRSFNTDSSTPESSTLQPSSAQSTAQPETPWHAAFASILAEQIGQPVDSFLARFNSVPLPVPSGALELIERLAVRCSKGYLMLASAPGFASDRALRLLSFADALSDRDKGIAPPVNFILTAERHAALGASTWQSDLQGGRAIQVALRTRSPESAPQRLADTVAAMAGAGVADAAGMLEAMRGLRGPCLDARLALIRASLHDPQVLSAGIGATVEGLRSGQNVVREAWVTALKAVWENHLPQAGGPAMHREIAQAAMQVGAWSLARLALRSGIAAQGSTPADLAHLAWCDARTGALEDAEAQARRAVAASPEDPTAREALRRIRERLALWNADWRCAIVHPTLPLVLEPLDASHAEALHYQYRDPQIAIMTGFPVLPSVDEARKWILEHVQEAGRQAYAVMHRDLGFVGYVGFASSGVDSYFCFWVGADFQGLRFGVEAARIACDFAAQRGIELMFTSAYDDNVRSIGALRRIGFVPMTIRAAAPDNDRLFLCLACAESAADDAATRLVAYHRNEKLPMRFPGEADLPATDSGESYAASAVNPQGSATVPHGIKGARP